ncbi:hypothetical protein [Brucella grignonensis]|uniref:Transposase n=1 Tax=Brucella grignonensis TaxID=94627 RepID=A0A256FC14_9HYPH|nr:hypothetical protein [Brucella grignonensis]OYR12417.1 hypothetical protein CEV33_1201 [Brucella grignonensis]
MAVVDHQDRQSDGEAVLIVMTSGRSVAAGVVDLGIDKSTLDRWRRLFEAAIPSHDLAAFSL